MTTTVSDQSKTRRAGGRAARLEGADPLLQTRFVAAAQDRLGAGLRQGRGHGPTEPARAPGNQRDLALQGETFRDHKRILAQFRPR